MNVMMTTLHGRPVKNRAQSHAVPCRPGRRLPGTRPSDPLNFKFREHFRRPIASNSSKIVQITPHHQFNQLTN
jgi:hypothetical protein